MHVQLDGSVKELEEEEKQDFCPEYRNAAERGEHFLFPIPLKIICIDIFYVNVFMRTTVLNK